MSVGGNWSDFGCSRAGRLRESLSYLGGIVKIGCLYFLYTMVEALTERVWMWSCSWLRNQKVQESLILFLSSTHRPRDRRRGMNAEFENNNSWPFFGAVKPNALEKSTSKHRRKHR